MVILETVLGEQKAYILTRDGNDLKYLGRHDSQNLVRFLKTMVADYLYTPCSKECEEDKPTAITYLIKEVFPNFKIDYEVLEGEVEMYE